MGAKRGRDPLLIEVLAELGAGRISEDFIRSETPNRDVLGACFPDGHIVVNPIRDTVDIVLHEALHRAKPEMSEIAVRRRTTKFMRCLTDAELSAIYDVYQRVAVKVKRRGRRSA